GGSSGIGLSVVDMLLDEGANVMTCGRDASRLKTALSDRQASYGERLQWTMADVRDAGQTQALAETTAQTFGAVDGLVNNAGAARSSTFATTTNEDWTDELSLKFFGVVNPSRAALPWLGRSGSGAVVNINAVLARQPEPHLVATSAA